MLNRIDWLEKIIWRYDPAHSDRWPSAVKDAYEKLKDRDRVPQVVINGWFWQLRYWPGLEPLCITFIDDPEFAREMIDVWGAFV